MLSTYFYLDTANGELEFVVTATASGKTRRATLLDPAEGPEIQDVTYKDAKLGAEYDERDMKAIFKVSDKELEAVEDRLWEALHDQEEADDEPYDKYDDRY